MNDKIRKVVGRKRVVVAGAVSVAILAVLAWKTNVRWEQILDRFQEANWALLAATFVYSGMWHIFVGADKWWRILRAQGAPVKYWDVFRVRLGSDPVRFATPLKVGEIVNAAYFGKIESFGFSRAAGSIAFDKALNLFGTVFWLYVGIALMMRSANLELQHWLAHSAVAAVVLAFVFVPPVRHAATRVSRAVHPKVGRLAEGVLSAFEEFSPLQKLGFLAYGIVFQTRPLIVCGLLFAAVSPVNLPSPQEFLTYGSVVVLMSNTPFTLGGIGPREAALCALFSQYGIQEESLYLIGLLMSFSIHILPAIVGIPFMFPLLRALTTTGGLPKTDSGDTAKVKPTADGAAASDCESVQV